MNKNYIKPKSVVVMLQMESLIASSDEDKITVNDDVILDGDCEARDGGSSDWIEW